MAHKPKKVLKGFIDIFLTAQQGDTMYNGYGFKDTFYA